MIRIGFAGPCMDYIDNPERILTLHNQNEADTFCEPASLVRLPLSEEPEGGCAADVIISRGLDREPLALRYPGVPLLELQITACELHQSVREARERFGSRRIAVIMPRGMLPRAELLTEALGGEAFFYDLEDASGRAAVLARAIRDGCGCVLSGRTVCRLAEELGVGSMLLRPREGSVYSSITQAKRIALRAAKRRESPREPCIVFDHDALTARRPAAKRAHPIRSGSSLLFYPAESEREALPSAQPSIPNA